MLLYFLLLFVGTTFAQVIYPGSCPSVSVKSDFDVKQYVGKWYEQRRYFAAFETGLECVTATYTANDNGTINISNQGSYPLIGKGPNIMGLAYAKTNEKAKLSVIFPSLPLKIEGSYWILDTDYKSYAVVWSCTDIAISSVRFAWILTRESQPSDSVLKKAYEALDKNEINKWLLLKTGQKNCPRNS